jgi:predicted ester cyclase
MSDVNKRIASSFLATLDRNDWDGLRAAAAPGFTMHVAGNPPLDIEGMVQFSSGFYAGFPDLVHTIDETYCEDNTVTLRITVNATHRGDFMGIAATGRSVSFEALMIGVVAGDKMQSAYVVADFMTMMQQLGVVPSLQGAPA